MTFINEKTVRALYDCLIQYPIFSDYKFPTSGKVEFVIVHDTNLYGQYEPEPHTITISTGKNGHLSTLMATMCHELIHMALYLEDKNGNYYDHKGRFNKLKRQVAKQFGFDPLEL